MENREKVGRPATSGLVFGTAIGAAFALAINQPIYWAAIGTGLGLVVGAIIDSSKKKN